MRFGDACPLLPLGMVVEPDTVQASRLLIATYMEILRTVALALPDYAVVLHASRCSSNSHSLHSGSHPNGAIKSTRAHRDVIGRRGRTVFRQRDRRRARAARGGSAKLAGIELEIGFDVESLASVVLQTLFDDLQNVVLGQSRKLAGVGNTIPKLCNRQRGLRNREGGFRHRRQFRETAALRGDVAIDVPVELFAAVEPLFESIRIRLAELLSVTFRRQYMPRNDQLLAGGWIVAHLTHSHACSEYIIKQLRVAWFAHTR